MRTQVEGTLRPLRSNIVPQNDDAGMDTGNALQN